MRTLIISTISLALLIAIWGFYNTYSEQQLHLLISNCEQQVMPAIEAKDWNSAYDSFKQQYNLWHQYQKKARYMLETELLNNLDESYARTLMYIKAKDLSNSTGELLALQHGLESVHKNETLSLSNIF